MNTAATAAEIKSAYRSLALKLHPDVNHEADASERFAEVSNAYGKADLLERHAAMENPI